MANLIGIAGELGSGNTNSPKEMPADHTVIVFDCDGKGLTGRDGRRITAKKD